MFNYVLVCPIHDILNSLLAELHVVSDEALVLAAEIEVGIGSAAPAVRKRLVIPEIPDTHPRPQVVRVDQVGEFANISHVLFREYCFAVVFAFVYYIYLVIHRSFVPRYEVNTV